MPSTHGRKVTFPMGSYGAKTMKWTTKLVCFKSTMAIDPVFQCFILLTSQALGYTSKPSITSSAAEREASHCKPCKETIASWCLRGGELKIVGHGISHIHGKTQDGSILSKTSIYLMLLDFKIHYVYVISLGLPTSDGSQRGKSIWPRPFNTHYFSSGMQSQL